MTYVENGDSPMAAMNLAKAGGPVATLARHAEDTWSDMSDQDELLRAMRNVVESALEDEDGPVPITEAAQAARELADALEALLETE